VRRTEGRDGRKGRKEGGRAYLREMLLEIPCERLKKRTFLPLVMRHLIGNVKNDGGTGGGRGGRDTAWNPFASFLL